MPYAHPAVSLPVDWEPGASARPGPWVVLLRCCACVRPTSSCPPVDWEPGACARPGPCFSVSACFPPTATFRPVEASGRGSGRSRARAHGLCPAVLACVRPGPWPFSCPDCATEVPVGMPSSRVETGRVRGRAHVFRLCLLSTYGGGEPGAPAPGIVVFVLLCLHAADGDTDACVESHASARPGIDSVRRSAGGSMLYASQAGSCSSIVCRMPAFVGLRDCVTERRRTHLKDSSSSRRVSAPDRAAEPARAGLQSRRARLPHTC